MYPNELTNSVLDSKFTGITFQGHLGSNNEDEDADEDDEDLGYSDTYAEYWPSKRMSL